MAWRCTPGSRFSPGVRRVWYPLGLFGQWAATEARKLGKSRSHQSEVRGLQCVSLDRTVAGKWAGHLPRGGDKDDIAIPHARGENLLEISLML